MARAAAWACTASGPTAGRRPRVALAAPEVQLEADDQHGREQRHLQPDGDPQHDQRDQGEPDPFHRPLRAERRHRDVRPAVRVGQDPDDPGGDEDEERPAAEVGQGGVEDRLDRAAQPLLRDPAGQRIRRGVREEPREHEGHDRADGEVDHHAKTSPRQPDRERDERHGEHDQDDDHEVEDADGRLGGLQPLGRHERDRAEVLGERHAEPVLEDPPDDAGRLRRCGIGKLDLGADDPRGLQLLERDEQHRVDLEHDLAVHDGCRIRLVPEQVHHPRVRKRQRPCQSLLHARLGEQRLETTRQPILQREGDGSGDRGDPVGQHIRQAGLDVKRGDDLRADACRQRVDDLGLFEGIAREGREPIGVERDLVRPHGNRRDQRSSSTRGRG